METFKLRIHEVVHIVANEAIDNESIMIMPYILTTIPHYKKEKNFGEFSETKHIRRRAGRLRRIRILKRKESAMIDNLGPGYLASKILWSRLEVINHEKELFFSGAG